MSAGEAGSNRPGEVTALVSGGASGLGLATATMLIAQGARVGLLDRDEEPLVRAAERLGPACIPLRADARSAGEIGSAIDSLAGDGPPLRVLVCCHGVLGPARLLGSRAVTGFAEVIEVNLVGTFNLLQAAAQRMVDNDIDARGERGVAILTASIAAFEGQVGQAAYASSKAGVAGLVLPAARELGSVGIRVVGIAPGIFETPMLDGLPENVRDSLAASIPFPGRFGDPAEFASLVGEIASNQIINGTVIRVDGALRLAPR